LEPFHAAQSLHTLGVDREALTAQERRDSSIAVTRMLLAQLHDLLALALPTKAALARPIKT
jgi:hypothetical protein